MKYDNFADRDDAVDTAKKNGKHPADAKKEQYVVLFKERFGDPWNPVGYGVTAENAADVAVSHRALGARGEYLIKDRAGNVVGNVHAESKGGKA